MEIEILITKHHYCRLNVIDDVSVCNFRR